MRFALDSMVKKGFVPLSVPTLVRSEVMVGTGYFPGGEEQAYRCDARDDLVLVGTAEVPVTALHQDEILKASELPKLYVALSSCYRREAGTYGKDTRGLYRVHQFQKVEQVVIDVADPARSLEHHQRIVRNAEEVLQALELPYRIVNVCGGDLGAPQIQKFDIETWMPSRKAYGEAAPQPALPRRAGEGAVLPHAQQHRRGQRAHADRADREPPAGRRHGLAAGAAAALHGRARDDRQAARLSGREPSCDRRRVAWAEEPRGPSACPSRLPS